MQLNIDYFPPHYNEHDICKLIDYSNNDKNIIYFQINVINFCKYSLISDYIDSKHYVEFMYGVIALRHLPTLLNVDVDRQIIPKKFAKVYRTTVNLEFFLIKA